MPASNEAADVPPYQNSADQHNCQHPRLPNVPLLRALWSLFAGFWGIFKGSWGVLDDFEVYESWLVTVKTPYIIHRSPVMGILYEPYRIPLIGGLIMAHRGRKSHVTGSDDHTYWPPRMGPYLLFKGPELWAPVLKAVYLQRCSIVELIRIRN